MTEVPSDLSEDTYVISLYLFCRHLEQNGLYDFELTEEGYNFQESGGCRRTREIHKVYLRSGASELLGGERKYEIPIVSTLEELDVLWKEANDICLRTGFWRYHLTDEFGFNYIFREGHYSVDEKYIPEYPNR